MYLDVDDSRYSWVQMCNSKVRFITCDPWMCVQHFVNEDKDSDIFGFKSV